VVIKFHPCWHLESFALDLTNAAKKNILIAGLEIL
jgi:hypothetical protein